MAGETEHCDEDFDDRIEFRRLIYNEEMTVHNPGRLSTSDSQYYHGGVLHRIASVRCASDTLPTLFHTIVTNGKSSAAALLGVYLMLLSLFVPFWLLSFLVTEWGIYIAAIGSIFLIGRSIIRMIAFPGASRRIVTEIEKEFAKYSVRMIEISCNSICELASLFEPREQVGEAKLDKRVLQQLPGVWRRVKDCRDRVLGVYVDVLRYIYQQDSAFQLHLSETLDHTQNNALTTSADRYGPGLTRFGNNRLMGDVGDVSSLPVRFHGRGRIAGDLRFCLNALICLPFIFRSQRLERTDVTCWRDWRNWFSLLMILK